MYVTLRYVVSAGTGRLTCEIFAKIFLPIVYNGLSATIFCVTRKIVYISTTSCPSYRPTGEVPVNNVIEN